MHLINRGVVSLLFDDVTLSTPLLGTAKALPSGAGTIVWQTFFATAPVAITVNLEFSLDNVNWDPVDSSTVTAGEVRTFASVGGRFVRASISALTGGTTGSVSILCQRI